jgi:hypothetical protein
MPVTLPPGRLRLATRPILTGSVPIKKTIGIVPQAATERAIVQDAAGVLGRRVLFLNASTPSEIESAFATIVSEQVGALVVSGETFFFTQRAIEYRWAEVTTIDCPHLPRI